MFEYNPGWLWWNQHIVGKILDPALSLSSAVLGWWMAHFLTPFNNIFGSVGIESSDMPKKINKMSNVANIIVLRELKEKMACKET